MFVLEEIVKASTAMFERLAQHETFHNTVDLPILVAAAQEKVVKWLIGWNPKKGRIFSWFSKCAKHAFLSEVVKVNQYRRRYHVTGDNLEKFYGSEDHEIDKRDLAKDVRTKLQDLTCRWGDPQEIGALKYLIECIVADEHDKQAAIRAASYAYGISIDFAKFFYAWALIALRDQMYDKIRVPFTEQDLLRHKESYSHLVDLLDIVTWDQMKRIIATRGGMRLKIPTMAQLAKLKEDYETFQEIEASDKDPDSIADIAKRRKKTTRTAMESYMDMVETLDHRRSGEHHIYDEHGY
jgi:hypothetical protein